MVSIKDVRASNESLKSLPQGLVAVFAGATAGIGLHSLKQLAKYTNAPRVYMIGRSKVKAKIILDELQVLNPKGTFIFHEGEFSLIKDVDRFSEEIKKAEQRVDILCMSPGYVSFVGREGKVPTTSPDPAI
jgi:short-subunit dehydrogenase